MVTGAPPRESLWADTARTTARREEDLNGPVEAAGRPRYIRSAAGNTGLGQGCRAATVGRPAAMTAPPGRIPAAITGAGLRMAERAWRATGWTGQNLRHVAAMIRQGRNPAARVYESLGSECFLALAPGWLNLGLWEGPGTEDEAEAACRRLVQTVASALPAAGWPPR